MHATSAPYMLCHSAIANKPTPNRDVPQVSANVFLAPVYLETCAGLGVEVSRLAILEDSKELSLVKRTGTHIVYSTDKRPKMIQLSDPLTVQNCFVSSNMTMRVTDPKTRTCLVSLLFCSVCKCREQHCSTQDKFAAVPKWKGPTASAVRFCPWGQANPAQ